MLIMLNYWYNLHNTRKLKVKETTYMMEKLVLHVGIDLPATKTSSKRPWSTNYSLLLQNYCYFYTKLIKHYDPNQPYICPIKLEESYYMTWVWLKTKLQNEHHLALFGSKIFKKKTRIICNPMVNLTIAQ